jgi:hypothetical protein
VLGSGAFLFSSELFLGKVEFVSIPLVVLGMSKGGKPTFPILHYAACPERLKLIE